MNNIQLNELWQKFSKAQSEEEQYAVMKDFMFNAPLEDLLEWNHYLGEKGRKVWAEHRKTGLSEADKVWYKEQFAKFDDLEQQIKPRKAA